MLYIILYIDIHVKILSKLWLIFWFIHQNRLSSSWVHFNLWLHMPRIMCAICTYAHFCMHEISRWKTVSHNAMHSAWPSISCVTNEAEVISAHFSISLKKLRHFYSTFHNWGHLTTIQYRLNVHHHCTMCTN